MSSANRVEAINPRRGAGEQIGFLAAACAFRHQLAGVPEHVIAVRDLVDRKVTLEHAARSPEGRDAGFHVWAESRGHLFRRRRFGVPIKAQGGVALTRPPSLTNTLGRAARALMDNDQRENTSSCLLR